MKIRSAFYVVCGFAMGLVEARAQATWTAASGNWSTAVDWFSSITPINGATGTAQFNGSTAQVSTLDSNYTLNSLTFQNTAALILNSSAGQTITLAGSLHIVSFGASSSVALNVPIVGSGGNVWLNGGPGTLTLNPGANLNTYSGSTQVYDSGVLADGGDFSFSAASDLYVGGGPSTPGTVHVNFNEMVPDIGDVSGGDGLITIASGKTLFISSGFTNTYSGVISGAGNLEKDGSSTQVLSGANTYTGTTTIGAGATLQLGDGTNNGSLLSSGISGSGGLSFNIPSSLVSTYAGPITGALGLANNGPGTAILSGINSYSGATTVNAGILKAGSTSAFGGASLSTVTVNNTGTLDLNGFDNTVGTLNVISGASVALGGAMLTIGNISGTSFINGVISGAGGRLTTNSYQVILTGSNTYTGATSISGGTLEADNASGYANGTGSGQVVVNSTGALQIGNDDPNGYINPASAIVDNGTISFFRDTSTNTFSNNITGSGQVDMDGFGTQILSGTNTYSGQTSVFRGILQAGSNSAFGGATGMSQINFTNSGTLNLNGFSNTVGSINGTVTTGGINLGSAVLTTVDTTASTTFAPVISGIGGYVSFGNNSVILEGANTYTGGTSITYGSVLVANTSGFGLGSGPIAIQPGAALDIGAGSTAGSISPAGISDDGMINFNRSDQPTYSNVISGTGGVTTNGGGVILTGANTYSGVTNLNTGTTILDNATGSATGSSNVAVASGAHLVIGNNDANGSLGTGALINDSGTVTFNRTDSPTSDVTITGTGSLAMVGTGNVTLFQNNSYSGSTTIQNGQLTAGSSIAFGNNLSDLTITSNGRLNMTGFNLTFGSITGDISAMINTGGGTLTTGSSNLNTTFSGIISGSGGYLVVEGSGTTTLGGANTYNNDTTVDLGAHLIIGDGLHVGAALSGNLNVNGSVEFNPAGSENMQVPYAINGAGSLTIGGLPGTEVTVTNPNGFGGPITINSGATLNIGGGTSNGNLPGSLMTGAGSVIFDDVTGGNFVSTIGGSLSVSLIGTGTYVLNAANIYTGPTTIENGTVIPGSNSAFGNLSALTVQNSGIVNVNGQFLQIGSLSGDGTAQIQLGAGSLTITNNVVSAFGGIISGSGGVTINGTGTEDFYGRSTYTGATVINGGQLKDGISDAFPQFSNFVVASPGSMALSYNETVGSLQPSGSDGTISIGSTTTLTSLGQAYASDFMGAISGLGSFTVSGGVQGLGGTNTYSGGTLITNGGELFVSSDSALGSGTVTFNAGTEFSPDANVVLGNNILLVGGEALDNDDGLSNNMTLAGTISETGGAGSITWCTPGTLTLYGNNSFTGGIDMREGNLVLGNDNAAGIGGTIILDTATSLNVLTGITTNHPINFTGGQATLTGSGTIATPISAAASVIIAPMASPGGGPGNLTFSSGLTLAPGGTIHFDLYDATGAAGTGYGLISATGGLSLTATPNSITFNIVSTDILGNAASAIHFSSSSAYSWMFATSTTAISGFNPNEFNVVQAGFLNSVGGGSFSVSQTGNSLFLDFTPVPEPSTWCLIGLGLAGIIPFMLRRRRLAGA